MKNKEQYFKQIYEQNKDKIFRICLGFMGNSSDADDLNQEILVKIWTHLESFRNDSSISTWIYRIATNTALLYVTRHHRKKKKQAKLPLENIEVENLKNDYIQQEEQINSLYKAIATLKEIDRIIIGLLLEGNSYIEIADITGLTVSNIGVRINRIKKTLHKKLN